MCGPHWESNWININKAKKYLSMIAPYIQSHPNGKNKIGINYGLHITGGEPFLNYNLLLKIVKISKELNIPSIFVETNCYWCINDEIVNKRLNELKNAGLDGILISVNPFILEYVPFERIERAINISNRIFNDNVIIYQNLYYYIFKKLKIRNKISFNEFLKIAYDTLHYVELIPMGRTVYNLEFLFEHHNAEYYFSESCRNELTRNWHAHIDNYGNYITGYCGGISLANLEHFNFSNNTINLDSRPIIKALLNSIEELYYFAVDNFNFKERKNGYISKCHLCLHIRNYIYSKSKNFIELNPKDFYVALNKEIISNNKISK